MRATTKPHCSAGNPSVCLITSEHFPALSLSLIAHDMYYRTPESSDHNDGVLSNKCWRFEPGLGQVDPSPSYSRPVLTFQLGFCRTEPALSSKQGFGPLKNYNWRSDASGRSVQGRCERLTSCPNVKTCGHFQLSIYELEQKAWIKLKLPGLHCN